MRDTIAWSYDLLAPLQQQTFRALAVCAGGFQLDTAEALCDPDGTRGSGLLDDITALVDASLLQSSDSADVEVAGEPRLWMLETIREYGLEQLDAAGETDAVYRRLARFLIPLAEGAFPTTKRAMSEFALRRIRTEQDNVRAVLGWAIASGEAAIGLELVGANHVYWLAAESCAEERSWAERVLALPGAAARTAVRARALYALSTALGYLGMILEGTAAAEESIGIWRELGERGRPYVLALISGGRSWRYVNGGTAALLADYDEAISLLREADDTWGLALALFSTGRVQEIAVGDAAVARCLMEESERLFEAVGERRMTMWLRNMLAELDLQAGDATAARARLERTLALVAEFDDADAAGRAWTRAWTLEGLGAVALLEGDAARAALLFGESLRLAWDRRYNFMLAESLEGWARVASLHGLSETAAHFLGAANVIHDRAGVPREPSFQAFCRQTTEEARAALGDAGFATAEAAGRSMPLEHAVDEALALATQLATPKDTAPIDSARYPDGLTGREVEVLRLIATGRSTREIAETLVISVATVERHISNLYPKIGARGRADATAYAFRHGLASPTDA
jgi:non-specific serine/threonine protein kinase